MFGQKSFSRQLLHICFLLPVFVAFFSLNATALTQKGAKEGILLVAFGTSVPEAKKAFETIDASYRKAFPDIPVEWAFTSQIIRKKLAARGEPASSIGEGLEALAKKGVKIARVQSLHVMAGEEFSALAHSLIVWLHRHQGVFDALYLGRPLLESRADAEAASRAVARAFDARRGSGDALVFMGHGQEKGRAGLAFEGARAIFKDNDPLVFMASVEGERSFDELLVELGKHEIKKVMLSPLMLVAGDHARNDLGGAQSYSWASRLRAAGYEVDVNLEGLGELPEIGDIFIEHTKNGADDLSGEPRKP